MNRRGVWYVYGFMLRFSFFVAVLMAPSLVFADEDFTPAEDDVRPPLSPADVPPPLRPWIDWALDGAREFECAWDGGARRCDFPGELSLEVGPTEARFSISVERLDEGDFELPGSLARWPEDVRVGGRPRAVLPKGGVPTVRLGAGEHRVEGRLVYAEVPESLAVPRTIGMVSLTIDGEVVEAPRRRADGAIWFEGSRAKAKAEESLELEVYRKVEDGVPLRVVTRVVLEAAGLTRKVELGQALVEGAVPVSLRADLPARLEPDGSLVVQVSAGRHEIEIVSRVDATAARLARPPRVAAWPVHEYWVFRADDALRQVEVRGADFIDPSRTKLPEDYRGLPTYVVGDEGGLELVTQRRGIERLPPNALSLERTLWLDLSGGGYSVRDTLSGELRRGHRLDLLAGELGRVAIGGEDQLITQRGEARGVEVRSATLDLVADSRLEGSRSTVPAVGWSEDVQSLGATLNLPPGFMLLGASGVDRAAGAWTERWNLGAIFFVLLLTIALYRLIGPLAAAVAFAALVITWGEPDAPRWIWLLLLVLAAIHANLQAGRLKRAAKIALGVAAITLLSIGTPFVREQIKRALHPHTAETAGATSMPRFGAREAAAPPQEAAPDEMAKDAMEVRGAVSSLEDYESFGLGGRGAPPKSSAPKLAQLLAQDPSATVQTGPGVPDWGFASHRLKWDGPVAADHVVRLYLVPPPLYRAIALLRVLALLALAYSLFLASRTRRPGSVDSGGSGGGAAALALAMAIGSVALPARARADELPPTELLAELRQRITRDPECAPDCVEISRLEIELASGRLRAELTVSAGTLTTLRLPGPASAFVPSRLTLDGASAGAVLGADGFLRVRVPEGVHRVVLEGPLPDPNALQLELPELPRRASAEATGYHVRGIREDGRADSTLRFDREAGEGELGGVARDEQNLAPWLEVTRTLEIGVTWEVLTEVRRVSPPGAAVSLSLALLPGESVTTEGVRREGESVVLTLDRDSTRASFRSRLPIREELTLVAPEGGAHSEVWRLRCGAIYACEASGVAPVSLEGEGLVAPTYRPFPGDSLSLSFTRPEAAAGRATTIDAAELHVSPGVRRVASVLTVSVRSSRGDALSIGLPEAARIESVTARGKPQPIRFEQGTLTARVEPGATELVVRFQEPRALGFRHEAPRVDLGAPAVNVSTVFDVPSGRWLLLTSGPSWGPAVLFWAKLFFVLLAAFLLSKLPNAPLRLGSFALLGLGLAQTSAVLALLVAGWFFVVEHRARTPDWPEVPFNARQIALPVYTLVAVVILWAAIYDGLLGIPDMQVEGGGSSDQRLRFYSDRIEGALPAAAFVSAPLWVYRVLMLAWALWLALSSVKWARWAFEAYRAGGLWRAPRTRASRAAGPPEGPPSAAGPAGGGEAVEERAPGEGDD